MFSRKRIQQSWLCGLLSLVACSSLTNPPTLTSQPMVIPPTPTSSVLITNPQDIYGSWQPLTTGTDATYLQFNEDGTCRQSFSQSGLMNEPEVECTYRFEESQLILTTVKVKNVAECSSPISVYSVRSLPENKIKLVTINDNCAPRRNSTGGEYLLIPKP